MKFTLTDAGKELMASLIHGDPLTFTKAEAGAEFSQEPGKLLAIHDSKQTLQIDAVEIKEQKAVLKMTLTNVAVDTEYILKQIGIYAKGKGSEVLFIVGQDTVGERVPAAADQEVEHDYEGIFAVDTAYEIRAEINANDFIKKKEAYQLLDGKLSREDYTRNITPQILELQAAAWTQTAPYTQRITAADVKETDNPIIGLYIPDWQTDPGQIKAAKKAYGCLDKVRTGNGFLDFTCHRKRPGANFSIIRKGV